MPRISFGSPTITGLLAIQDTYGKAFAGTLRKATGSATNARTTLYTVPANKAFYLMTANIVGTAGNTGADDSIRITDTDGSSNPICVVASGWDQDWTVLKSVTWSGILFLPAGTVIEVYSSAALNTVRGDIVGYEVSV